MSWEREEQLQYYYGERRVAADPTHPNHLLPPDPPCGSRVLDVGCGSGWPGFRRGTSLFVGVDVSMLALRIRQKEDGDRTCINGMGEYLPFRDRSFDHVFSRVAIPYMSVPRFLSEAYRVLSPGGTIWFTCHRAGVVGRQLIDNLMQKQYRGAAVRGYVLVNGFILHLVGRDFHFPFRPKKIESFQTRYGMQRLLRKVGFVQISSEKNRQHLIMTARRPRLV